MVTVFTLIHHSYPFNQTEMTSVPNLKTTSTNNNYDKESENATNTNLDLKITKETFREVESEFSSISGNVTRENATFKLEQRDIDEALEYGFKAAKDLYEIKEPLWYSMGESIRKKKRDVVNKSFCYAGLYLDKEHPASRVAAFNTPSNSVLKIAKLGYISLETSKKLHER